MFLREEIDKFLFDIPFVTILLCGSLKMGLLHIYVVRLLTIFFKYWFLEYLFGRVEFSKQITSIKEHHNESEINLFFM